jgi:hypothetical protein
MAKVLLDTNLLLLTVVGRTDPLLIGAHKRTQDYGAREFTEIEYLIGLYDGVVTTPHILAEAGNLLRQIGNPARDRIQDTFRAFILGSDERIVTSAEACLQQAFLTLGLTDSALLVLCAGALSMQPIDRVELLTADRPVYNQALALGLPAELYA